MGHDQAVAELAFPRPGFTHPDIEQREPRRTGNQDPKDRILVHVGIHNGRRCGIADGDPPFLVVGNVDLLDGDIILVVNIAGTCTGWGAGPA